MQPILDEITDYNGNQWHKAAVDTYNNYTRHFNSCRGSGELANQERESILDRRHQFYVQIVNMLTLSAFGPERI